jgi:hypothetical protein
MNDPAEKSVQRGRPIRDEIVLAFASFSTSWCHKPRTANAGFVARSTITASGLPPPPRRLGDRSDCGPAARPPPHGRGRPHPDPAPVIIDTALDSGRGMRRRRRTSVRPRTSGRHLSLVSVEGHDVGCDAVVRGVAPFSTSASSVRRKACPSRIRLVSSGSRRVSGRRSRLLPRQPRYPRLPGGWRGVIGLFPDLRPAPGDQPLGNGIGGHALAGSLSAGVTDLSVRFLDALFGTRTLRPFAVSCDSVGLLGMLWVGVIR